MKVVNPETAFPTRARADGSWTFYSAYDVRKAGLMVPDNHYPCLLYQWPENEQRDVLSVTVKGIECQVRPLFGKFDHTQIRADVGGSIAYMSLWRKEGALRKRDGAYLDFAGKEISFSDTDELPADLRGLATTMLEALGKAVAACVEAHDKRMAASAADEAARRAAAIEDIKRL